MIIDVHGHYTTAPAALDAFRGRQLSTLNRPAKSDLVISDTQLDDSLEPVISQMDARRIDAVFFSPRAAGMGHDIGDPTVSRFWTEVNNDLIARACARYPSRLVPVCSLPQSPGQEPQDLSTELERCAGMGFVGCLVNPDVSGGLLPFTPPLGDRWWYPLWQRLSELQMPAMIHASATRNPGLQLNGAQYIAWDQAAVVELCMSTVKADHPDLVVVVPHGGGAIPFQFNRQRALHGLHGLRPFEEAIRDIYLDTAVYDADSMEMLVRKVGAANLLYGSEMFGTAKAIDPLTGHPYDDNRRFIDDIDWLSPEERDAIYAGNARRLYPRAVTWLEAAGW